MTSLVELILEFVENPEDISKIPDTLYFFDTLEGAVHKCLEGFPFGVNRTKNDVQISRNRNYLSTTYKGSWISGFPVIQNLQADAIDNKKSYTPNNAILVRFTLDGKKLKKSKNFSLIPVEKLSSRKGQVNLDKYISRLRPEQRDECEIRVFSKSGENLPTSFITQIVLYDCDQISSWDVWNNTNTKATLGSARRDACRAWLCSSDNPLHNLLYRCRYYEYNPEDQKESKAYPVKEFKEFDEKYYGPVTGLFLDSDIIQEIAYVVGVLCQSENKSSEDILSSLNSTKWLAGWTQEDLSIFRSELNRFYQKQFNKGSLDTGLPSKVRDLQRIARGFTKKLVVLPFTQELRNFINSKAADCLTDSKGNPVKLETALKKFVQRPESQIKSQSTDDTPEEEDSANFTDYHRGKFSAYARERGEKNSTVWKSYLTKKGEEERKRREQVQKLQKNLEYKEACLEILPYEKGTISFRGLKIHFKYMDEEGNIVFYNPTKSGERWMSIPYEDFANNHGMVSYFKKFSTDVDFSTAKPLEESFNLRDYLQNNWLLQESVGERQIIETTDFSEVVDQVLETPEPFDDACRVAEQYLKIYHKKARQKLTSGDKAFIHTFGTKIDDIGSEVGESFEWKWPERVPRGWDWDRFISELELCYKKAFEQEFGKWKNLKTVLDGLYTLHTSSGGFGSLTIDDQIFQSILDLGEHFGFEPGQDFSIVTTSPPTFLSVDSQNVEVYYGLPELEGEKAVEALVAAFKAYERDEDVKQVLERYWSDKVGWTNVSEMSNILKGHVLRDIKSFLKYPDMCQALPCQLHDSL